MVKWLVLLAVVVGAYFTAWWLGKALGRDAVNMAVGVLVGTFAGIPALTLLALTVRRPMPPERANNNVTVEVVHRLALPGNEPRTIDGTCTAYTTARPFALLEGEWR